jgi:hypothetical protein
MTISRTASTVLALAAPMRAFYLATRPVVDAFNALGNRVLRPFGILPAREAGHAPHSKTSFYSRLPVYDDDSRVEGLRDIDDESDRHRRTLHRPRSGPRRVDADLTPYAHRSPTERLSGERRRRLRTGSSNPLGVGP